jgi:hypothetical protein
LAFKDFGNVRTRHPTAPWHGAPHAGCFAP